MKMMLKVVVVMGGDDVYKGKAKPMLVLVSDLYSEDEIISVGDSRYSSYSAYTVY